jgi:thiol-disulfide isomerase/thioredoxin
MKINLISILLFLPLFCFGNIDFITNYSEGVKRAKAENKIIFIDVTASWCGPCKLLERNSFHNPELSAIHNEHFINIQLDEKYNKGFLSSHNINGFPTLIYMDSDENIIFRGSGVPTTKSLISIAKNLSDYNSEKESLLIELLSITDEDEILSNIKRVFLPEYYALGKPIIEDVIIMSPIHRNVILTNFGSMIDTTVLNEIFEQGDSTLLHSDIIRDQMGLSYFCMKYPLSIKNINYIAKKFESYGFADITKLKAFLSCFYFYNLNFNEDLNSLSLQKKIFGETLLNVYPTCEDRNLVLQVIKFLSKPDLDIEYFKLLQEKLLTQLEIEEHYQLYDLLSICQLHLGVKEATAISISRANEIAFNSKIKYTPAIKYIR